MDLLTKPLSLAALDEVIQRALRERSDKTVLQYLQARDNRHASVEALVGRAPAMLALRELIRTIAQSEPADGSPVSPVNAASLVTARSASFVSAGVARTWLVSPAARGDVCEASAARSSTATRAPRFARW